MDINILTTKLFFNSMIKVKATHLVCFNNWSRHFNLDKKPDLPQIYSFIFLFFARK